jgi:type VI secretion system secreted protein Hcp
MAVDIFLKVEGVTGEAQDGKHGGEIDVLSWAWGVSNSGTAHAGGGAGAGKAKVEDLSLTKYVDKSSTSLFLYCCNGKHVPECKLTVRKAGGESLEYIVVTMKDCLISSVKTGGTGEEDRLTESVKLNFAKVEVQYTPQKADGTGDAPTQMGWDIAKNVKT